MNRQKAIELIKVIQSDYEKALSDYKEALEEAIKALEALDKIQEITEEVLEKTLTAPIPPYTPSIALEDKLSIPKCCKNCSNHPSNGGDGICNCTLPYFEDPIKWSVQGNMTIDDWTELAGDTKYVSMLEVLGEDNHED